MQTQNPNRQRKLLTAGIALVALVGASAFAAADGATAGSAPRPAVSKTDATAQPAGAFIAVTPIRVLDTRPAPLGPIGVSTSAKLGADATMDLQLAGEGKAIPANATSAMLNITIDDDATAQSYLTVWPTGEARPLTSANNALPTLIASNSMLAKLGANGSISIYNQQGAVNIVIDLVGYLVPLSTVDGPGAQLTSGAGVPANTVGNDGDFYIDTTNHVLYGPKAAGVWPVTGVTLGGAQGAASAYNTTPVTVTSPTDPSVPVAFGTAGPAGGSVARTNSTTFTVSASGLYTADYHLDFTAAAAGTISVFVNGVTQGPVSTLTGSSTNAANTVLVNAAAGDTVQLRFTPTVIGSSLTIASSSIVVEQTTNA